LPNVGPYIYDVSIPGFTRSSIYIYDISSLRVKVYVVQKFKKHKIKNHSDMFRITYDPKHVGVIFNFTSFKFLYNVDFNL